MIKETQTKINPVHGFLWKVVFEPVSIHSGSKTQTKLWDFLPSKTWKDPACGMELKRTHGPNISDMINNKWYFSTY